MTSFFTQNIGFTYVKTNKTNFLMVFDQCQLNPTNQPAGSGQPVSQTAGGISRIGEKPLTNWIYWIFLSKTIVFYEKKTLKKLDLLDLS